MDKQSLFAKYEFMVTGPSSWIVQEAKKSSVLIGKDILCVPNCYDETYFYKRTDRDALKKKFQINTGKKIILFGAAFNGTSMQGSKAGVSVIGLHF